MAICDDVSVVGEEMSYLEISWRLKANTNIKEENLHPQRRREGGECKVQKREVCLDPCYDSFSVSNI